MSPAPFDPSPSSVIEYVLVTSIDPNGAIETTVGSFVVFPSVSSPSSLWSVTSSMFPRLLPVTVTVFSICPLLAAELEIR